MERSRRCARIACATSRIFGGARFDIAIWLVTVWPPAPVGPLEGGIRIRLRHSCLRSAVVVDSDTVSNRMTLTSEVERHSDRPGSPQGIKSEAAVQMIRRLGARCRRDRASAESSGSLGWTTGLLSRCLSPWPGRHRRGPSSRRSGCPVWTSEGAAPISPGLVDEFDVVLGEAMSE